MWMHFFKICFYCVRTWQVFKISQIPKSYQLTKNDIEPDHVTAGLDSIVAVIKRAEMQTTPTHHKWATVTESIKIRIYFPLKGKYSEEYLDITIRLLTTVRITLDRAFSEWERAEYILFIVVQSGRNRLYEQNSRVDLGIFAVCLTK